MCVSCLQSLNCLALLFRSLCEDPPAAEWQEAQEEEDHRQEEDSEPLFQRVVQL